MATLADSMIMVDGYFRAKDGKEVESKKKIPQFLNEGKQHPHLKSYTFARRADGTVHWTERAESAEEYLAHLETIAGYIDESFELQDFERIEVAGPASEIEKLKTNKYLSGAVFYETEEGWNR
uniref:Uncharacterized protein n=1 Tax=Rhodosorus marinus TaxID=101924 RepID=A0A7S0G4T4_9RHOD|mmetsp:Transcript_6353/g.9032  ORF Transcript_6353/g.9032 Transcript_6353/m.9032 type:complete len:123 (+) Transcript_6353:222-590(+)|eukprot:CAMPEP_0184737362 /NCGR_PEP_ID=MMETSP0315-20130426/163_1 /TAXON_ID=101924 /ORGANISM="Rhodosorus marinus, Strain UTEX LB 2760" /LENGTH=122 /DNA_ID=CAMNT_0027204529 /DNA_START=106 /DNA_END=474 /DNA_ORIENTATION=-